jgi:hypothetical protein
MLSIYERVRAVLLKNYNEESEEFKKGVQLAMSLIEIGIKKSFHYNQALRVKELEEITKKQKAGIRSLNKEIANLRSRLNDTSLVSGVPTEEFGEINIGTSVGEFSVVTNMTDETMMACLINFEARNTFNRVDEAKSKLLTYINSKNYAGFYAYKDWKAYRRSRRNKT